MLHYLMLFLLAFVPLEASLWDYFWGKGSTIPVEQTETSLGKIRYSISFREISEKRLWVECEFQSNSSGITYMWLPNSSGRQLELYKNISDFTCLEHTIEETDKPHCKRLIHEPNASIIFRYAINLTNQMSFDNLFLVQGDISYFYARGYSLFILPSDDDEKHITLSWEDIPQNWKIANNFGKGKMLQEITASPYHLWDSIYIGGDLQTVESHQDTNEVYIAINGEWPFSPEEFSDLAVEIFNFQKKFWSDYDFPFYLICLFPKSEAQLMGGGLYRNNSVTLVGSNQNLKDPTLKSLAGLLAHELFHSWNPGKIIPSESHESMQWFTEGFTDYYAVKLNYKNGIISEEEYVNQINEFLKLYYLSPVHNASNEIIPDKFWTDYAVMTLPYQRGFAIALFIDVTIKSSSLDISLDNLMLELLALTKEQGNYSQDDLYNLMAKYISESDLEIVKECVKNGSTVPVLPNALGDSYFVQWNYYKKNDSQIPKDNLNTDKPKEKEPILEEKKLKKKRAKKKKEKKKNKQNNEVFACLLITPDLLDENFTTNEFPQYIKRFPQFAFRE